MAPGRESMLGAVLTADKAFLTEHLNTAVFALVLILACTKNVTMATELLEVLNATVASDLPMKTTKLRRSRILVHQRTFRGHILAYLMVTTLWLAKEAAYGST